jgi:hypothetical protein
MTSPQRPQRFDPEAEADRLRLGLCIGDPDLGHRGPSDPVNPIDCPACLLSALRRAHRAGAAEMRERAASQLEAAANVRFPGAPPGVVEMNRAVMTECARHVRALSPEERR